MTKSTASIEISEETLAEFNKLKAAIAAIYNGQEISNDQIMEAMIGGFFDSLEHIQKAQAGHGHHHHDHDDHDCCGGSDDCENKKDGECCGGHKH